MFKRIFSAYTRFKRNIWTASLDSGVVTMCIGMFLAMQVVIAIALVVIWPVPTISAMVVGTAARLIYAGLTAR
jgi:hypothetical protein